MKPSSEPVEDADETLAPASLVVHGQSFVVAFARLPDGRIKAMPQGFQLVLPEPAIGLDRQDALRRLNRSMAVSLQDAKLPRPHLGIDTYNEQGELEVNTTWRRAWAPDWATPPEEPEPHTPEPGPS